MKKILTAIAAFSIIFSASMAYSQVDLGFGVGTAYAYHEDINKWAFDGAVSADFMLDKLFSIGLQGGFGWIKRDIEGGDSISFDSTATISSKRSENIYTYPLLVNAKIYFPMGSDFDAPVFQPYITLGAGYAWANYKSDELDYWFKGLAYQGLVGAYINPGEGSQIRFMLEAGFRGTDLQKEIMGKDYELPMNSFVARAGVVFALGGGSSW